MSSDQDATAIKAALNAALSPIAVAYDYDEVPGAPGGVSGTLPLRYVVIDLTRRYVRKRRFGGWVPVAGGRLGVRYAATSVSDARELRRRAKGALEDITLPVSGGGEVGPFSFEAEEPIGWGTDMQRHDGRTDFTF